MKKALIDKETEGMAGTGDLRERLVAEAAAILETQGLDAVTLRAVAGAAGVSHMAPYRHFADKDSLLAAVAERGFRALSADMGAAAGGERDTAARLHAFGMAYLAFARRRPALYRLMFGPALACKPQSAGLAEAGGEAFAHCADAVAAIVRERGAAPDTDPRALAIATWSLVHGLAMLLIDRRLDLPEDARAQDELIGQVLVLHGKAFG
ncbi:TetR/AcrR family transcriptional regulator [Thauera sinica]|uniref:TetR/AcrR family transcriptional regulator n=1 Tax=Thauera sinica TaxID=2665146 RepID=A0ABW1AV59_9RHOO|nr:TetR/AcrR family transcriptional regulator [Thauera sp. K11]